MRWLHDAPVVPSRSAYVSCLHFTVPCRPVVIVSPPFDLNMSRPVPPRLSVTVRSRRSSLFFSNNKFGPIKTPRNMMISGSFTLSNRVLLLLQQYHTLYKFSFQSGMSVPGIVCPCSSGMERLEQVLHILSDGQQITNNNGTGI